MITIKGNFFVAEGVPSGKLRSAGFAYSPKHKVWATPFPSVVKKVFKYIRFISDDVKALVKEREVVMSELCIDSSSVYIDNFFNVPKDQKQFPFQRAGTQWILDHVNTLLADDMGLGKTIQVIVALNELQPKTVLIICPASLKKLWLNEMKAWLSDKLKDDRILISKE